MLRNKKILGIAVITLSVTLAACNKSDNQGADTDYTAGGSEVDISYVEETDDDDGELTKPAEKDRITIELGLVKNDIYSVSIAPTLNRNVKDTNMEKYNVTGFSNTQQVAVALNSKEIDMAIIDVNTAAKLYNENQNIKILAANTMNNIYVSSLTDSVDDLSGDVSLLQGKTVYVAQDNSSAQTVIEKSLENSGCTIEYVSSNDEIVNMIEQETGEFFAAPEPYMTTAKIKNSALNLVADLSDTWKIATNYEYPTSCLVATTDFVEKNEASIPYILYDHETSVNATVHAPTRTAQWSVDNNVTDNASFTLSTMQNYHFTYYDNKQLVYALSNYYRVMNELNDNAVPTVPDNDIYYTWNE